MFQVKVVIYAVPMNLFDESKDDSLNNPLGPYTPSSVDCLQLKRTSNVNVICGIGFQLRLGWIDTKFDGPTCGFIPKYPPFGYKALKEPRTPSSLALSPEM